MKYLLIFNHHSLPYDTKYSAYNAIPEFLHICIKCSNIGLRTILVDESIDAEWYNLQLSPDYFWRDWVHQRNLDENKDLIRAFLTITTKQPLFTKDDTNVELYEVDFHGNDLSALRAAFWHESPLVSFPSESRWKTTPLSILIRVLDSVDGELKEDSAELLNFFSLEAFDKAKPNLIRELCELSQRGKDVLDNWNIQFPFLIYCGKIEEQLRNWSNSKTLLSQISESLLVLNSFVERWKLDDNMRFTYEALREHGLNHQVSGESESVKTTPKKRKFREFYTPSGSKEFFEHHIKLSHGYRIHFHVDKSSKSIYIAYIGTHLPL